MISPKLIYESAFLTIHLDIPQDCLIQKWKSIELDITIFKNEMLEYLSCYKIIKPRKSLWNHEHFMLELNQETAEWIEQEINIPCSILGNEMLAFVVGESINAHMTVIRSFKDTNSCIKVEHFATNEDAYAWLITEENIYQGPTSNSNRSISKKRIDSEGNCVFELIVPKNELSQTLMILRPIIEKEQIILEKFEFFKSLTSREKEVFQLYSSGKSIRVISELLGITELTVRTHWRNIKFKLEIKTHNDIQTYAATFL